MELKTSTPNVRVAYIECMLTCFNKTVTTQATDLIPSLNKSIDRAIAQPTQAGPITEGLCAARLLLRIAKSDANTATKMQTLWNNIYDMEKQLFINEKFLTIASEDALLHVTILCETLLLEHGPKITGKEAPLYKAIIHSTSITPHHIRKIALGSIKQLVSAPKAAGANHACALLAELSSYMLVCKIQVHGEKEVSENARINEVHPHVFVEVSSNNIR